MFGHSLPLRAWLDVIHLVALVSGLVVPVGGLGLLYLALVALVPILKLLLSLDLQFLLSCALLLVLLPESLLLLLLPLPHELGLLLRHEHLGHPSCELSGSLALIEEVVVGRDSRGRGQAQVLSYVSELCLLFS